MTESEPFCIAGYERCLFRPDSDCCERCGRVRSNINIVSTAEWKSYSVEEDFERSRVETGVSNDIFNEDDIPMRDPFGKRIKKSPAQRRKEAFESAVSSADFSKIEDVFKALKGCAVPFEKDVHAHLTRVCENCDLRSSLSNKVWIFYHNFVGAWCRSSAPLVQARITSECNDSSDKDSDSDDDDGMRSRRTTKENVRKSEIGKKIIVEFIKKKFPKEDKYICGCIHLVCKREQQMSMLGYLSFRAISVKSGCASVKEIYAAVKAINKVIPPCETVVLGSAMPTLSNPNYDGIIELFSDKLDLEFPAKKMSKNVCRMLKEFMGGYFVPETVGATAIYLVCSRVFQEKYKLNLKNYASATGLSEKTLKKAFSKADSDPRMFSLPFKEAKYSTLSKY